MGLPSVFVLYRTLEIDVELGGDPHVVRVELFRAAAEQGVYRARLWRSELFRLTPSFPRDEADRPTEVTDDAIFVEWAELLEPDYERFEAASDEDAEAHVLAELERVITAASRAV